MDNHDTDHDTDHHTEHDTDHHTEHDTEHEKDALSSLERRLLGGQMLEFGDASVGQSLRYRGLIALGHDQDLEAVDFFRQSKEVFETDTLERAISERLYGLALIRVQREVEGTFALERADAILDREGYETFSLE
jgi:hypothetical protein